MRIIIEGAQGGQEDEVHRMLDRESDPIRRVRKQSRIVEKDRIYGRMRCEE